VIEKEIHHKGHKEHKGREENNREQKTVHETQIPFCVFFVLSVPFVVN